MMRAMRRNFSAGGASCQSVSPYTRSRAFRSVEHVPHSRQQIGARPRLREERQRRVEWFFTTPASGIATGKEEGSLAAFAPVDLIEPAATEPAHYEIGENQLDRRGMVAEQVQR